MKLSISQVFRNYNTILLHGLVWSLIVTGFNLFLKNYPFLFDVISGMVYLALFYLNALLIYPKLLNRKYWWLYIICFLLIILASYHTKILGLELSDFKVRSSMKPGLILPTIFLLILSSIYRIIYDKDHYEKMMERKPPHLETEDQSGSSTQMSKAEDEGVLDHFFVHVEYQLVKIVWAEISYIQGLKDYVKIFFDNSAKPVLTRMNLKSIMEKLPSQHFTRIHKSYIINISKVSSLNRNSVAIGEAEIPVGTSYKENLPKITKQGI